MRKILRFWWYRWRARKFKNHKGRVNGVIISSWSGGMKLGIVSPGGVVTAYLCSMTYEGSLSRSFNPSEQSYLGIPKLDRFVVVEFES